MNFAHHAVRIALTSGLSRRQVADDLGVGLSTLNKPSKLDDRCGRSASWSLEAYPDGPSHGLEPDRRPDAVRHSVKLTIRQVPADVHTLVTQGLFIDEIHAARSSLLYLHAAARAPNDKAGARVFWERRQLAPTYRFIGIMVRS